jgi:hypothetical protein
MRNWGFDLCVLIGTCTLSRELIINQGVSRQDCCKRRKYTGRIRISMRRSEAEQLLF